MSGPPTTARTFDEWRDADRQYRALSAKSIKAAEARSKLPPGSSRARVTTANARWMLAAEARDRREAELRQQWDGGPVGRQRETTR